MCLKRTARHERRTALENAGATKRGSYNSGSGTGHVSPTNDSSDRRGHNINGSGGTDPCVPH